MSLDGCVIRVFRRETVHGPFLVVQVIREPGVMIVQIPGAWVKWLGHALASVAELHPDLVGPDPGPVTIETVHTDGPPADPKLN